MSNRVIILVMLLLSLSGLVGCANKAPASGMYTIYASVQDVAKQQHVTKPLAVVRPESFRRFEGYAQPIIRGLRASSGAAVMHVAVYADRKLPGANQVDSTMKSPASLLLDLLKQDLEEALLTVDDKFADGDWPRANLQVIVFEDKQDGGVVVTYEVVADYQMSAEAMKRRLPELLLPEPARFTITWDQGDRDSEVGLQKWQDSLRPIARAVTAEIKKRMGA